MALISLGMCCLGLIGRSLFNADDGKRAARACSGDPKNRLLFGKLLLSGVNVMIIYDSRNHMEIARKTMPVNNARKQCP